MNRRNFIKSMVLAIAGALLGRGKGLGLDQVGTKSVEINGRDVQWGIENERGVIEWHPLGNMPTFELVTPIDDRTPMSLNGLVGKTFTIQGTYTDEWRSGGSFASVKPGIKFPPYVRKR